MIGLDALKSEQEKVIEHFEKFLTLLKDADLPEVADARERVASLKNQ